MIIRTEIRNGITTVTESASAADLAQDVYTYTPKDMKLTMDEPGHTITYTRTGKASWS